MLSWVDSTRQGLPDYHTHLTATERKSTKRKHDDDLVLNRSARKKRSPQRYEPVNTMLSWGGPNRIAGLTTPPTPRSPGWLGKGINNFSDDEGTDFDIQHMSDIQDLQDIRLSERPKQTVVSRANDRLLLKARLRGRTTDDPARCRVFGIKQMCLEHNRCSTIRN